PRILLPAAYGVPAAFIAALFFFLSRGSASVDFSSIQSSIFDFLNRHRLPNLNAGIFCSFTYLYKVSGLTPRYCEAWRMFITSRESAIYLVPPPTKSSLQPRPFPSRQRCANWENQILIPKAFECFGVLSISQPELR